MFILLNALLYYCTLYINSSGGGADAVARHMSFAQITSVFCYALHMTDNKTVTTRETLIDNKGLIIVLCLLSRMLLCSICIFGSRYYAESLKSYYF